MQTVHIVLQKVNDEENIVAIFSNSEKAEKELSARGYTKQTSNLYFRGDEAYPMLIEEWQLN